MEVMIINGEEYIRKSDLKLKTEIVDGMEYKIVRTYSAGVFAGYVKSRKGQEVVMIKARRLWSWAGAASLSQLAEEGTSSPEKCKFPCEVSKIELFQLIEMLDVSEKAKKTIDAVKVWSV